MVRILSIVPYQFLPAKNGGHRAIAGFYKYLSKDFELFVVSTHNNEFGLSEGYEIFPIFSNRRIRYINPFNFFRLKKLISKYQVTHLLIEHPYFGWLAWLLKISTGIKLIVRSHNIEALRWKSLGKWWWRILWQYEKFTHRQADLSLFIQKEELDYAVRNYRLDPAHCMVVTFGIELEGPPSISEIESSKELIRTRHGIKQDDKILFFNGSFNYKPNLDGLLAVLKEINPNLIKNSGFAYKLLIAGSHIPEDIKNENFPNVIFAGFVDDINSYYKATDVFLNPIIEGGGIKTKLIEALGFNCNVVSTAKGAIGVDPELCNGKLQLVKDHDWVEFANCIFRIAQYKAAINPDFFDNFYWGNITRNVKELLESNSSNLN